jgi:preprotein translocase subunit YajC
MSNKNLFQAVKEFINSKEPGKTFTTKEFHDAMRGIESKTFWKAASKNEFYRSNVYRGYLRRLGFVEIFTRGTWRIIAPIPSWVDSGTANFVFDYMYNYKAGQKPTHYHDLTLQETKQKIADHIKKFEKTKQENSMKNTLHEFKEGDRVKILSNICGSVNKVGEVGIITNVTTRSLKVFVPGNGDDSNWSSPTEIELTDEPLSNTQIADHIKKFEKTKQESSMKYHEFKVGDRVKILSNLCGSVNKVGEVGIITEVDGPLSKVFVQGNGDDINWSSRTEIELTDEPLSNTQIVETTQKEYIYAVVTNSGIYVFKAEDEAKKLVRENAAKHSKLSKIYKVEFGGAPFGFDLRDFQFFGGKEIDMAKELARELVGDGRHGRVVKNLWFVTEGPYHMVNKDGDNDYELLDGYSDEDTHTYGPFLSYEDACEKYDEIDLDACGGIGQVIIEDRECGQVKEKFLVKKIVIDYDYDENDDSRIFYGK